MKKIYMLLILSIGFVSIANANTLTIATPWWGYGENVDVNMIPPSWNPAYAGQIMYSLDGSNPLAMYCLELMDPVEDTQTVNIRPLSEFGINGEKIAWLLNTYASGVSSDTQGAALQLAIWEVRYDALYNLGAGTFQVISANGGTLALANTYLNAIGSNTSDAIWFDTNLGQDLAAPIPEPASFLLLGTGLGALCLGFLRRKK